MYFTPYLFSPFALKRVELYVLPNLNQENVRRRGAPERSSAEQLTARSTLTQTLLLEHSEKTWHF